MDVDGDDEIELKELSRHHRRRHLRHGRARQGAHCQEGQAHQEAEAPHGQALRRLRLRRHRHRRRAAAPPRRRPAVVAGECGRGVARVGWDVYARGARVAATGGRGAPPRERAEEEEAAADARAMPPRGGPCARDRARGEGRGSGGVTWEAGSHGRVKHTRARTPAPDARARRRHGVTSRAARRGETTWGERDADGRNGASSDCECECAGRAWPVAGRCRRHGRPWPSRRPRRRRRAFGRWRRGGRGRDGG